jgi:D-3-phosphoglycerate dehydrogenase
VLGTPYVDLSVEEAILAPRGVELVAGGGATPEDVVAQAADADVILTGSAPRFDASVIERLECRGIVRYGVGVETVDLEAAARAGMWVAYVPDYGTDAVALHAVTLLLAAIRRLPAADALVKRGAWGLRELRPLHSPDALTAGIVGFGRIGRRVAELLGPFGFSLSAHDAYVDVSRAPGVRSATLDEIITSSDAITLHLPARHDGRPLLGAAELARMKPGAVLINTARGSLIDQDALIDGLQRGTPAIAALDVFESEPPASGVFADVADRVLLTPHMAWYTEESELDLRTKAAHEVVRILQGAAPLHVAARPSEVA